MSGLPPTHVDHAGMTGIVLVAMSACGIMAHFCGFVGLMISIGSIGAVLFFSAVKVKKDERAP